MAVVGAKAKEAFGGPFRGQDYNGNNYTKHQIKCHEVSRTFQYLVLRYQMENMLVTIIT